MILDDFLKCVKALVIAPAGHGKTHFIAECAAACREDECQLILTHTHAGIASLKQKLKDNHVSPSKFALKTITGFAQELYLSYASNTENIRQEEEDYFDKVVRVSCKLLSVPAIKTVVSISFQGLFVDEYQDCTLAQHEFVMQLSNLMPTRILGDPLQSIFDFNGERLVDFDSDLQCFNRFDMLTEPWRWKVDENSGALGQAILDIRNSLVDGEPPYNVSIPEHSTISVCVKPNDDNDYFRKLSSFLRTLEDDSVLVIVPCYKDGNGTFHGTVAERIKLIQRTGMYNTYKLLEAIDDKKFYTTAREIDDLPHKLPRSRKKEKKVLELLEKMSFQKTELCVWFDKKTGRPIKKRGEKQYLGDKLRTLIENYLKEPTKSGLLAIITFFICQVKLKSTREDLLHSLWKCLSTAVVTSLSVYEEMVKLKNQIRVNGRKVNGRCIGTTLLTKGLEFDTVVILDADKIPDRRNFYVAISRACKHLFLIVSRNTFSLQQ